MTTESPNSYTPPKPPVTGFNNKLVIFLGAIGIFLIGIMLNGLLSDPPQKTTQELKPDNADNRALILSSNDIGDGLLAKSQKTKEGLSQSEGVSERPLIQVIRPPKPSIDTKMSDALLRDQEQIRRQRGQLQMAALMSPVTVKKASNMGNTGGGNSNNAGQTKDSAQKGQNKDSNISQQLIDRLSNQSSNYDPAASKDKEDFFSRVDSKDKQFVLDSSRVAGSKYEVKTGFVIPSLMISGINSDLPGSIIAQVSQNVYDSATGRYLLLPQGSKLFGLYDSRVMYGQERVLIAWNRVIFPDGTSMNIGAMPGADMAGYAGFTDEIDNHYFRTFGSAILMSMITGSLAYTMDTLSGNSNSNSNQAPSLADQMTTALAQQLGQATMAILQKNLNVAPTLTIRPGYQFNVMVIKDMVFQAPYKAVTYAN